jgi:hypothetical protein
MPYRTAQTAPPTAAVPVPPDFVIALDADERTADAARYCVGTIARPVAAARGRAELLTGALLARTRSGRARRHRGSCPIELRVWSRSEAARVEVAGPAGLLPTRADDRPARLLDHLADRWGVEGDEARTCVWFEVDGAEPE